MKLLILKKIVLVGLVFSIVDLCQIYAAEESKSIIIPEDYDGDSANLNIEQLLLDLRAEYPGMAQKNWRPSTPLQSEANPSTAALQESYFNYDDVTRIYSEKEDLKYLDELIAGNRDLNKENPEDLINAIMLADYLSIKNRSLLKPILLKIQEKITLPIAIKLKDIGVPIANFGIDQVENASFNAIQIKNATEIKEIVWSPNSSKYAITYLDGRLQMYNSDGRPIGTQLYDVDFIIFSPFESRCVVIHYRHIAQWYRLDGLSMLPIERPLFDEIDTVFSPDRSKYALKHRSSIQLYNSARQRIGTPLDGVNSIVFNPNGSECAVISSSYQMQKYHLDGRSMLPIGTPIDKVESVVFSPDGSKYALIYWNRRMQFYDSAGRPIETPLDGRTDDKSVVFSPDGSNFAIIDHYNQMQLYRLDGLSSLPIGAPIGNVKSIVFSPDGSNFAITHFTGPGSFGPDGSFVPDTSIKLYDSSNGQPIESHLDIRGFSPDFSQYWVMLNDGQSVIIPKFILMLDPSLNSSIKLGEYLLFTAILNEYMLTKKPVFLNAALSEALSYEIISKLLKNKIITVLPQIAGELDPD